MDPQSMHIIHDVLHTPKGNLFDTQNLFIENGAFVGLTQYMYVTVCKNTST